MAIYKQLFAVLENHIITEHQNGFCSGKSTETTTTTFLDYIYKGVDEGKHVGALFFIHLMPLNQ